MAPVNKSRNQTAFTVSIEAKGVTTGISAKIEQEQLKSLQATMLKKILYHQAMSFQLLHEMVAF